MGFLGYTDAYGEQWLQALTPLLDKAGIKLVGAERFARADTSVTAQALKLHAANPDAMVIVASGSSAAMPQLAMVERGFKGKVYQTHAAATRDLMRVGGKATEGTFVTSGPVVVAEQLPDSHPSKALGMAFNAAYEKIHGAGMRNQFAAHSYDVFLMLDKAVPVALKKAKPGTPEFRAALKDALESTPALAVTHGVLDYSSTDHWGFRADTGVVSRSSTPTGSWNRADPVALPRQRAMDFPIAAILGLDGITNGAIYALVAIALVLVFAVTRIVFIPQGEVVAFGALTMALFQTGRVPGTVWLLLIMAVLAAALDAVKVRRER